METLLEIIDPHLKSHYHIHIHMQMKRMSMVDYGAIPSLSICMRRLGYQISSGPILPAAPSLSGLLCVRCLVLLHGERLCFASRLSSDHILVYRLFLQIP